MDVESIPTIPHLIEEVPDFKSFIEGAILDKEEVLVGHTKPKQVKFYLDGTGCPRMKYTREDEKKTSTLRIIDILRIPKCGGETVEEFIINDISYYRLNLHRKGTCRMLQQQMHNTVITKAGPITKS